MIRRLVLDVLKPHNLSVVELSEALNHLKGVEEVNVIIYEIDQQVENAKVIIAGSHVRCSGLRVHSKEDCKDFYRTVKNRGWMFNLCCRRFDFICAVFAFSCGNPPLAKRLGAHTDSSVDFLDAIQNCKCGCP